MRRPRLSYANVVSSIALFIALGGTGYAVTQLPRNSVGNRQLKSNAVTSAKIRAGAVQRSDLAASARTGSRGVRGPAGPAGTAGATGPTGPSETIQVNKAASVSLPPGAGGAATLVTVTLTPGSWMLNAQTKVASDGGDDFVDCFLTTTTGERLGEGTVLAGTAAGRVQVLSIPSQAALTVTATTQVAYVCAHPFATGPLRAERTSLLATRVGSIENR